LQAEVVAVGSELLLGQIVDTNSAVIARHLAAIGLDLFYKTTVGDNLGRLTGVLRQALDRSDVVITTGGIGPTADDVTREAVAAATGRDLEFSPALMATIEAYFAARGLPLSPSNRRQAYIPSGAIPIENPVGTAPGFIVEHRGHVAITLPGVPREMEYLLTRRVIPYLKERFRLTGEIRLRVVKTVGLGESRIGELLADFMEKGANPTVGTLAHLGQVDVRIAAKAGDAAAAEALIAPVEAEIRARLGDAVFGVDATTLESEIAARLATASVRVAVVEVGTGGHVVGRLSPLGGATFAGGVVAADLAAAVRLGLAHGASAEPTTVARQLAHAAAKWAGAGVGAAAWREPVADSAPPTHRVLVAVAADGADDAREYRFGGDLPSIQIRAATMLLDLVRRVLPAARAIDSPHAGA
jgi:nicotinamide-nucleotide amidase